MELSRGFIKFQQSTNWPHTARNSLMPTRSLLWAVEASKGEEIEPYSDKAMTKEYSPTLKSDPTVGQERTNESEREIWDKHLKGTTLDSQEETVETHIPCLSRIFQLYCSYGEPTNTTKLKSSKWIKLLRDAGLVKQGWGQKTTLVSQVDADLLFTKMTKRKGSGRPQTAKMGRMEFEDFVIGLKTLAK